MCAGPLSYTEAQNEFWTGRYVCGVNEDQRRQVGQVLDEFCDAGLEPHRPNHPDLETEVAQARLVKADNPIVVVSRSGRNPATVPALVRFCELMGLPVAQSAKRRTSASRSPTRSTRAA